MAHLDEAARRLSKTGTSLYAVLELKKGASPEDIKKAYRHLSSCVPCSLVVVVAAAAVIAVEPCNHLLRRRTGGNINRMSVLSLGEQEQKITLQMMKIVTINKI
uniref:DnaJ heat shock protein family (Hsp40) member C5 gamma n=1 Tax=Sciurus vulgaris TaxID=55149 RepID=A0A8D2JTJ9_SCIVU